MRKGKRLMRTAVFVLAMVLGVTTVSGTASAQADCGGTRAVLRLHAPKDALEELLNRAVPGRMEGREAFDTSLLRDEYVAWSMTRSPIRLVTEHARLRAYTTIAGGVRVKGKVPLIGTDFSAGPDLTIDAALALQPVLDSDWRLHPNVSAHASVTRAMARILGADVNVRTLSQLALDGYLARMEERVNERFAEGLFLRKEAERIWNDMHRVDRISIEQLPGGVAAWFVARPTRIAATDLFVNETGFDIGISVFAETDLVIGNEPKPAPRPLPPLEFDYDLPDGKIELDLPVFVDWKTANGLIAARLEEPVLYEGDYARLQIAEARLSHGPGESAVAALKANPGESAVAALKANPEESAVASLKANPEESVLVSAVVTAGPKGFIGWVLYIIQRVLRALGLHADYFGNYGEHRIAISVRPEVSEDGRRIAFRDARLLPESAYLMETLAADYYGLTAESLRTAIESHLVLNLDERLADAETMAREKAGEITRKLGDRGLGLDVEIRPETRLASVSAIPEGLVARFCAAADVDAIVLRLGL